MATRRSLTTYATIRTEGGLLPPDLLDRVQTLDASLGGLQPTDYGLTASSRLDTEIAQAWQAIQTHFASFRRTMEWVDRDRGSGTSETRAWVQQVLRELGFRDLRFVQAAETIDGRSFLISHRAGEAENAPPLHIVSYRQKLDDRASRTGGGEQRSPQALMQGYLNTSHHLWGVVTNGLVFRLLRENRQIDRALRVEFDLEGMLEAESFAEFRLFWLLLNRSRFVQPGERHETAWLERWSQTAASEGTRALTGLSDGVERAIEALGQGLLSHPENAHLREQLQRGELTVDAYYSELLRLVYRFLFLLVAEERHLLFTAGTDPRTIDRYRKHYSIERLRGEATRSRNREAHHDDLWRGLLVTFDAMRYPKEAYALGLEPLGGGLFGARSCPHVADDAAPGTEGDDRIAGRPMLANAALLDAVQALSEVTRDGVTRRVNYRDLDVEELGSVYESLLEHRPSLEALPNNTYRFGFSVSTSRKETGSYYTPGSLVQELLNSALDPVIDQALERMRTPEDQKKALLALTVCDPACGSGHFLLGAARRIGRRLAEIDAGPGNEPDLADVRHGVRQAIRHCVYGVDKNPLAIDLCKTALWIESHEPGAPVSFLDHHIKRGDSLVGVFDLDVLQAGIPDDAYKPVTGDDKKVAGDLKKRNKVERPKETSFQTGVETSRMKGLWEEDELENLVASLATKLAAIEAMPDDTIDAVKAKEAAYDRLQGRDDWRDISISCDLWTYAFFAPMTRETSRWVPTSATVRRMVADGNVPADIVGKARGEAASVGFFHWPLQFPEVFQRGGFDTVLGNPPWEQVQPEEKKFFATRAPEIAEAAGAKRKRMIARLEDDDPELARVWHEFVQLVERSGKSMRESGRFPLTARGKVNLYSLFAEHFRRLVAPSGRAGVIVPTGIATDDSNKVFFADIVDKASLAALYDFENRKKLFEAVDSRMKFSLMVLAGRARQDDRFRAGFFLLDSLEIHDPEKTFLLGADDIALLNPNTRTCPIFRSARDAELTKAIYRAAPVLVDENKGDEGNPWGVTFRQGLFNMTSDSHLFRTREELESDGATLGPDGRFRKQSVILSDAEGSLAQGDSAMQEWLPLYEAKMCGIYDHRAADVVKSATAVARQNQPRAISVEEKQDFARTSTPLYWVAESEVVRAVGDFRAAGSWFLGLRDVTSATNERTGIFTAIPWSAVGHKMPLIATRFAVKLESALYASFNSMVFDSVIRQKVGGTSLGFFIAKQLPVLPPETYTDALLDEIAPRVLELSYTAHDMAPFARDLGYHGEPFTWDEQRRAQLRADLDGIYAHLYGISRDDFAYILDTFPIVRRKDETEFGEYRTKRLCLEAYDRYANHPAITGARETAGAV